MDTRVFGKVLMCAGFVGLIWTGGAFYSTRYVTNSEELIAYQQVIKGDSSFYYEMKAEDAETERDAKVVGLVGIIFFVIGFGLSAASISSRPKIDTPNN